MDGIFESDIIYGLLELYNLESYVENSDRKQHPSERYKGQVRKGLASRVYDRESFSINHPNSRYQLSSPFNQLTPKSGQNRTVMQMERSIKSLYVRKLNESHFCGTSCQQLISVMFQALLE
uniref:Uncharacterized protein n=3 Tax=Oryza TaxID=4527 RepID=Q53KF2_ORYSJ|nr:hypothetical protein LOC_Os11g25570 [Oryza sativa Japonica Group]ABA93366.1 hypothetical protein LOC_Os11g25570 [Oryza sativa Japonica Group]